MIKERAGSALFTNLFSLIGQVIFLFQVLLQEDCKSAAVSIDNDRSLRPSSIMLYSVVVGSDGHGNLADAMIV